MTNNKNTDRIRRITWLIVALALVVSPLGPTVAPANAITETEPSPDSSTGT